ncbi:MAG: 60 kDa chaperonin [Parcubacteria group bacterium ADurb.Bin216]|nr:MAG: 60 kDa chaperonin [Parcubacteria group bacterium ADurb.Bin216]
MTERLAKLVAKVAVLYVGAATETEMNEKKDRIDDAIKATRAAILQGYVPGGGQTLYDISTRLNSTPEVKPVLDVFKGGLRAPFNKIITNAGKEPKDILFKVTEDMWYNAATDKYENMSKAGIIDPTLVVVEALTNAVSAANMLILSEVTIHDTEPRYQPADPAQYQPE